MPAALLAQLVEHQTFNLRVMVSSPISGEVLFFLTFPDDVLICFWSQMTDVSCETCAIKCCMRAGNICKFVKSYLSLPNNRYLARKSNWEHYFYVSYWRGDRHFTCSSEPPQVLAAYIARGVPSFLSYFKTLSIGPAPGIEPRNSRSSVKRSTD